LYKSLIYIFQSKLIYGRKDKSNFLIHHKDKHGRNAIYLLFNFFGILIYIACEKQGGIYLTYILSILIGYFAGCFQTSYILVKQIKKTDIRSLGNGNAGASNTTVSLGWKYGVLVGLLDIAKAVISVLLIRWIYSAALPAEELIFLLYLNGFSVILGHNYPFFMGFKGGKGTASLVGMIFAINLNLGLLCLLTILLVTVITDYIALGTIALVITFLLSTIKLDYGTGPIIIALIITLLSIYKHIPNIGKIKKGEENGLRKSLKLKK